MVDTCGLIVVAVGPDGSPAAVSFGIDEAVRCGRGLHLVHAVDAAADEQTSRRRDEDAAWLLSAVGRLARQQVADIVPVSAEAVVASPAEAVRRASAGASLVVLGRRARGLRGHHQLRSVTERIPVHVTGPVVSVPDTWPQVRTERLVVVGVDPADVSLEALSEGFRAACSRDARLVLIVGTWPPSATDRPQPAGRVDEVARAMRAWYDDVPVEVIKSPGSAVGALVAASYDANLVVMARRSAWRPTGMRVDPDVRPVLRDAVCPVLLSPDETDWMA
ncbi:MAG TPA: universal stress protein [Nocardioides sp.]|uniref:universal stress protein n=1 Tax=Nocardioides sp. TaxID=35761 RepID=UPI002C877FD9|nr:universal stress protein [Nocardioides sp.]HTW13855.1 universal stress protein [Nocardioides sp.]